MYDIQISILSSNLKPNQRRLLFGLLNALLKLVKHLNLKTSANVLLYDVKITISDANISDMDSIRTFVLGADVVWHKTFASS